MIRFTRSVQLYQDAEGKNPDEAAPVRVLIFGTATEATIFSDDAGTIPLAQPFLTNLLSQENPGQFTFVVSDGTYDIEVNGVIALASEQIFSQAVIPVIPVLPDIDIDNIRYSELQHSLLDILNPNELEGVINGSLSWVRPDEGTLKDRYGIIQTAAINEPRQEAVGWLIEGASENLCLQSSTINTSLTEWQIGTNTTNDGTVTAPDGSSDAYAYTSITIPGSTFARQQVLGLTIGNEYTFSCIVRSPNPSLLTTGTIGTNASVTETILLSSITDEWVRYQVKFTSSATSVFVFPCLDWDVSGVVEVWGAQVEELPFASSYIPTVASSAPRDIEPVIAPIDNNAPLFEDPFTVITKFTVNNLTHDDLRTIAHISSGLLVSNGTSIYIETNGNLSVYLRGTLTATLTAVTPGVEMSIALSYDGTDAQLYVNGVEVSETILVGAETGKPLRIGVGTQDLGVARSLFGNINTFKINDTPINADEAKFIS